MRDFPGMLGGWWCERMVMVSRGRLGMRWVWVLVGYVWGRCWTVGLTDDDDVPVDGPDAFFLDDLLLRRGRHRGRSGLS